MEELVDVADGNRMAGQRGEKEAARFVKTVFEDLELENVEVDEFEIGGWWRDSASLRLLSPRDRTFSSRHEIIALPATPASTVRTEIVDVGVGTPGDFEQADIENKIVLVGASDDIPRGYDRRFHRTEKYHRAIDAGASGFLYWAPLEGCLPSTGWVSFTFDDIGEIPACGISKEVAERLKRYCGDGEVIGELQIQCENAPTTSQNVSAAIGPDTEEEVLVSAHIDAHDIGEGAVDNGTGCALLGEIGRLLSQFESQLETKVRLIAFGAEEAGSLGAKHWLAANNGDDVKCILNLDGIGHERTLDVCTCQFEGVEAVFAEVREELQIPIEIDPSLALFADQWPFVERGIPGLEAKSIRDDDDRRWGLGRLWSHTDGDTLDKLDNRDLRDLVVPLAASVFKLSEQDRKLQHKTQSDVKAGIDSGTEEALRITNRWPWE
ncbi:M28 family peptidase [Halobacteria archaeon AArc-curdl1]|uniref:Carboxypeptidase Q n=1 Tax=Natronosalvus hydrolyticus TaxID=2979988 RepID=A0AAP2ZE07_9EURY|nr:M28 family peptidase [Halobacteria archaeon AArc-curdl1]